jgi:hypothetical protein
MTTLAPPIDAPAAPRARAAHVGEDSLILELADGRSLSAPLAWYPRLLAGNAAERTHFELIGEGEGIHWPDLDEDLSVESVLAGRPSGESLESFRRWLLARSARGAAAN